MINTSRARDVYSRQITTVCEIDSTRKTDLVLGTVDGSLVGNSVCAFRLGHVYGLNDLCPPQPNQ